MEPIAIDTWEPHPEKPGMSRRTSMRLVRDVHAELRKRLEDKFRDTEHGLEGLSLAFTWTRHLVDTWPENHRWIACYAVTGANEGHYIHVDLLLPSEGPYKDRGPYTVLPMFMTKTFGGMEHAQRIAAFCAESLGA